MKTFKGFIYICFAVCVHGAVLPMKVATGLTHFTSRPQTPHFDDDHHIPATQASLNYKLSTVKQEASKNTHPHPLLHHEITEYPYPMMASISHVPFPPSNITITRVPSIFLRVISSTKRWAAVRNTGRRGDTRPVMVWIKTSRGMVSELTKRFEDESTSSESILSAKLMSRLNAIDQELECLKQSFEIDGQDPIWSTREVLRVKRQILPKLEEVASSFDRL